MAAPTDALDVKGVANEDAKSRPFPLGLAD
jgi:hypothetical protein